MTNQKGRKRMGESGSGTVSLASRFLRFAVAAVAGGLVLAGLSIVDGVAGEQTTIEGGRMELIDKGEVVLFKGGVTLRRGNDVLQAAQMRTTRKKDRISANGNVRLFRRLSSTQTLKGYGQNGFYNSKTGDGYLVRGRKPARLIFVEVLSSTRTRRTDIFSDRIDFEQNPMRALATGSVYGKTIDPDTSEVYEFWSDRGEYKQSDSTVVLSGEPKPVVRLSKGDTYKRITGKTIIYNVKDQRFSAEGATKAVLVERKNESLRR